MHKNPLYPQVGTLCKRKLNPPGSRGASKCGASLGTSAIPEPEQSGTEPEESGTELEHGGTKPEHSGTEEDNSTTEPEDSATVPERNGMD